MADLPGKAFTSIAKDLIKTYFDEQYKYQRMDVKAKIQEMTSNLKKIKALIAVADEMEIKEQNLLAWLSEMKNAIYNAEYVMDVFEYQRLKNEVDGWPEVTKEMVEGKWKEKVSRVFKSSLASCSKLPTDAAVVAKRLLFADEDHNDLLEFVKKFENLVNGMHNFSSLSQLHLAVQNQKSFDVDGEAELRETTSAPTEIKLFGRDEEEKHLLKLLLQSSGVTSETARCFDVVSVVGIGGVGKTTLAQSAYNHQSLNGKFDIKAWVCVSTNSTIKSIMTGIVEDAGIEKPPEFYSFNRLQSIQDVLKKGLHSKRFLIVIDDAWEDMEDKWETVCVPFRNGKEGSKILVTSPNRGVTKAMGAEENIQINLNALPSKDFWEFFQSCAFRKKSPKNYQQLEQIAQEIALQLRGLPLAAKTVGGLLYTNFDVYRWRDILNSKKWKEEKGVIPALKLSYRHLPKHLRKCFAYCCLFLKDFKYEAKTLIDIWIALDCVTPEDKNRRRLVDIQKAYINELVSRCFLDVHYTSKERDDGKTYYVIHDLLHNLAENIVGDEVYRVEDDQSLLKEITLPHCIRHLYVKSATPSIFDSVLQKLDIAPKQLRSLVLYDEDVVESAEVGKLKLSEEAIQKLKGLRLFIYSNYNEIGAKKVQIWENLGDMLHLRCASLHFIKLISDYKYLDIPASFWKLHQLEIFRPGVNQVGNLNHLYKLISIRHVDYHYNSHRFNTSHLGRLKSLEEVPGENFIVDGKAGNDIGQLGELSKIGGGLVLQVHNKLDEAEARKANLNFKQHLKYLALEEAGEGNIEAKAIEALHPHTNLNVLTIDGCRSITLTPDWLPLLSNLTILNLFNLPNLQGFPSDLSCHLLSLKQLKLRSLPSVKQIEVVASGPIFPSLSYVELKDMKILEGWTTESFIQTSPVYFPKLYWVEITKCPKLLIMTAGSLPNRTIVPFLTPNCCLRLEQYLEYSHVYTDPKFDKINFHMLIDVKSADDYNDPQISILFSRVKEIIFYVSQDEMNELPASLLQKFTSLETLVIEECDDIESLDDITHHLPPANKFIIRLCTNLRFLSAAKNLQTILLSSIETLVIDLCSELESLTDDSNQLPPSINTLIIKACDKLKLPPSSLQMLSCIAIQIGCASC